MAESERARIVRLAGRLKLLVWAAILVAAALYLAARAELVMGQVHVVARSAVDLPGMWIARDLSAALLLLSLWQLAAMLSLIERGDRFSPAVTRRFRNFALLLFVAAAVTLLAPLLIMVVAPPPRPHAPLQLPFNFRDIWTMLVTGVLFLVARLLDEAQRIESDLSEIV